ncbi:hypothetical protein NECAME_04344 [Necator americanus]|uniref:Uncharacterized protein n=1 Tax=Necator americanus TaxID=51031 RepID=W2SWZ8_NECAM|nr:hypothetical protein NECAME_04344 [Necator americanus]ETN73346.1 hypothetical protein NECAME_04344 [Necator americanus]
MDWFGVCVGGSLLLGIVAFSSGYPYAVNSFSSFIDWLRTGSDEWIDMQNQELARLRKEQNKTGGRKSAEKYERTD